MRLQTAFFFRSNAAKVRFAFQESKSEITQCANHFSLSLTDVFARGKIWQSTLNVKSPLFVSSRKTKHKKDVVLLNLCSLSISSESRALPTTIKPVSEIYRLQTLGLFPRYLLFERFPTKALYIFEKSSRRGNPEVAMDYVLLLTNNNNSQVSKKTDLEFLEQVNTKLKALSAERGKRSMTSVSVAPQSVRVPGKRNPSPLPFFGFVRSS